MIPKNKYGQIDSLAFLYNYIKNNIDIPNIKIYTVHKTVYEKGHKKGLYPLLLLSEISCIPGTYGVREDVYQIDIYSETLQDLEDVKYSLLHLLHRRNIENIRITVERTNNVSLDDEKGLSRNILYIHLFYKDKNF